MDRRTVLKWLGVASGGVAATSAGAFAAQGQGDGKGQGEDPMDAMPDGIETARVRVGHLISDAPPVDLRLTLPGLEDVVDLPAYEGLRYGQVVPNIPADYADFPAGVTFGLRVTPAGDPDTTVVEIPEIEFEAGRNYTLLAIGELDSENDEPGPDALALVDNPHEDPPSYGRDQLPSEDETDVRVVHALPDFTDDFRVAQVRGGGGQVGNVKYSEATDYATIDPHGEVSLHAEGETIATVGGFRPGTRNTVYVVSDTPEPGGNKPVITSTIDAVARPNLNVSLENAFED